MTSVVQVLRETLADHAGQARSFNVDLLRSTDRIGTLANVDDIRELKRLIASEARELKHAVVEKQRRDDVLFTQMSKRVDALQTQLAEAQKQAELDPLTEIANRRGFDRAIKEWSLLAASPKQPFSIAMVDIDDFKRINDTYQHGHQVGDRVLLCLAQRLVEDAGENQFVARVGGELRGPVRTTTMDSAVERMTATLKRVAGLDYAFTFDGQEQRLGFTCSAGVTEFNTGEGVDDRSSAPIARSTRPSAPARTARSAAARACSGSCRGCRARPPRPSRHGGQRDQRQRNSFTDKPKVPTV